MGIWDRLLGRDPPPAPTVGGPAPAGSTAPEARPGTPTDRTGADGLPGHDASAAGRPAGGSTPGRPEAAELEQQLVGIVRRVNRAGGTMPEGGVPAVHAVEDVLRPLLVYLRANPPTEAEMIPIRAIVTDYLPTTVDSFLALPHDYAATHRNRQGRTASEELLEQLRLLHQATVEYATAIYDGDAQQLTNQGRFLRTKFGGSDLDL